LVCCHPNAQYRSVTVAFFCGSFQPERLFDYGTPRTEAYTEPDSATAR